MEDLLETKLPLEKVVAMWMVVGVLLCSATGTVFCICQNVTRSNGSLDFSLKTVWRDNAAAHVLAYTVHMALHIYVAVCLCLFFDSEVDV